MGAFSSYSPYLDHPSGTSGSGLDQVLGWIASDPGLAGANEAFSIRGGLAAANALNGLLVEGLRATGGLDKAVLSAADIVALNAWFRDPAHPERLQSFVVNHGDDEDNEETGFHQIQNDGGNRTFDGRALIDTVLDGIYHIGFPLNANGTRLTNEDGNDNALLTDVARWLTALKVDLATDATGLDRIVETIVGDPGLQASIPWSHIRGGAQAANDLNTLIHEGIKTLDAEGQADDDPTRLSAEEVTWINQWIRQDKNRLASFIEDHGDDENGVETGFHLVQNDGATTRMFGLNAVNTVFDGIYHIGFEINDEQRFENEDGNANALVSDVAEWLTYYYGDPSTTGSGLDRMVDWIKLDPGLPQGTSARDINDGLAAADGLNHILLDAIKATGVNDDGWLSRYDLRVINRWVRENAYDPFVVKHGDDENGEETGFHLIQNDGASTNFFGHNLVNTVVDGIYHYGFEIRGENFLNEDGNNNQSLSDVSGWLNYFLSDRRLSTGTWGADVFLGNAAAEHVLAYGGDDRVDGQGGSDLLDGGWGNDTLLGGSGDDVLDGGFSDDVLDGGEGSDTYLVSGADNNQGDWQTYSFQGNDTYADTGSTGVDVILAEGVEGVDIGLRNFSAKSGIEQIINATEGQAQVRLLSNWEANTLDFSQTEFKGGHFLIDAGWGNDTVIGTAQADVIRGGGNDDLLNGGDGSDTYLVSGFDPDWVPGRPYTFEGYDIYNDSGTTGVDVILASGAGPVDVGLRGFAPVSGIERIVNGTTAADGNDAAQVRLLDTWESHALDFSATELVGGNLLIDGCGGNDTIHGSQQADLIRGGGHDDLLDGGDGGDTYLVAGSNPDWVEGQPYLFEGFDVYHDTGSDGVDQIIATGEEAVDIGLRSFGPDSGIERIVNGTFAANAEGEGMISDVRLLGNWEANILDFSATELVGPMIVIDAGSGADTVRGSASADVIRGGKDNDLLDGALGADTYLVSGHNPGNPDWATYDFEGYNTYHDSGIAGEGVDALVAEGFGPVDMGFLSFNGDSGIEEIRNQTVVDDGNGGLTTADVGLIGNWEANLLDFSSVTLVGGHFRIAGESGNDTLIGSAAADRILGGGGDDLLQGGAGDDCYEVSGWNPNNPNWQTYNFSGYDSFADSAGFDRIVATAANGLDPVDIGLRVFTATNGIDLIDATGTLGRVLLLADWQNNLLDFSATELRGNNLSIDLGDGNDTFVGSATADRVSGGYGSDLIRGGAGDDGITAGGAADTVDGGEGSDTYFVSGKLDGGWQSFGDYDIYKDSGSTGTDRIVAVAANGNDGVDIGLVNLLPASGIETIDARGTTGVVRLLGDWRNNGFDFSSTELLGANISIDSGGGNDTVVGSAKEDRILGGDGADTLTGGEGTDTLNGGAGSDTYVVGGTLANAFAGFDVIVDSGTGGGEVDRIQAAAGTAPVDIAFQSFSLAANGIEAINASTTSGTVRLVGDATANSFNFTGVTLTGSNISIEVGAGNDAVIGSAAADRILAGIGNDTLAGGAGDDTLIGGEGSDTYLVSGTSANGFGGFDLWADGGTGAGDVDRLVVAPGSGAVDVGMKSFSAAATGLEEIDGTATSGVVRLLGDATANSFNFTGVKLLGANLRIDVGSGTDTVVGSASNDVILGGLGDDLLNGADGSDTYVVSGTSASGFEGNDTWADRGVGAGDVDRLVAASGTAAVDIAMKSFSAAATGLEVIDATGTSGVVRLLGDDAANNFNFTGVRLLGANLRVDVGAGNDVVRGSADNDTVLAGLGVDSVDGGAGDDILTGGGGLDALTGGAGADTFVYTLLTDAITGGTTSAPTFERISDFVVGADRFDVSTAPPAGAFRSLGAVSYLTTSAIGMLLNSSTFVANGAATFTYGSGAALRTFIAFNNATAGYSQTADAIVEISNVSFAPGFANLSQITII